MTFMRIFPFEVRVFAHFTLKQGKKQELKQINSWPWRKSMTHAGHQVCAVMSGHLGQKDPCLSPFK
jgi:hypothetical protein